MALMEDEPRPAGTILAVLMGAALFWGGLCYLISMIWN